MAEWPSVEEVEKLLDLGDAGWIEDHLEHALAAAIESVKTSISGSPEKFDADEIAVTERMRQASLRAVQVLRVNAPDDGWRALAADHIYQSFLTGQRRQFGVA